jgi:hypothetical protein
MKTSKTARFLVLAAMSVGVLWALPSCVMDTVISVGGVAFLDAFLSPLVGDSCTLFNQAGC